MVTPGDPNGTPAGATRRAPLEVPSAGSTVARLWVPWFILAVALILTGMASLYVRASTSATERARFDHLVEDAQDQAAHSMDLYGSMRTRANWTCPHATRESQRSGSATAWHPPTGRLS
jgi:hypothetical protein